ncbi:MAG: pseudouridine-5-phosphate glycosidase [Anaerolineaceae bacterium 4572_5.1]|nr:MAG: pseudouridine-5-phosphate glycosidase [Anaerolineaceae bacterium 4572_5.1]
MKTLFYSKEIKQAKHKKNPIVALETAVVTHGLPYPVNLELAQNMEKQVRDQGAVPATVGVLEGKVCIGLKPKQLHKLAEAKQPLKISRRDFAGAIAKGLNGGTTVAGTLTVLPQAGIRVFATGGIGGVHRDAPFDISADLPTLGQTPVIVVCAGAKSILDLPATLEYLETMAIPVIGYKTDEFPAFYARTSGLPVSVRADSTEEVTSIAKAHWKMGARSAVLVVVPPPEQDALPEAIMEEAIAQAMDEAQSQHVRGQQVTPFLLSRVSELTGEASLKANLSLLLNNARIAAKIAKALRSKN